jgi:hypothetical protein
MSRTTGAQRAARYGNNGRRAHQLMHGGDHVRLQQRPVPQRVYRDAGRHGGLGVGPLAPHEEQELDRGGGERRADLLAAGAQHAEDAVLHDGLIRGSGRSGKHEANQIVIYERVLW